MGFRIQGIWFRDLGKGLRVQDVGDSGSEIRPAAGFQASGLGSQVSGFGFRDLDFGFRNLVWDLGRVSTSRRRLSSTAPRPAPPCRERERECVCVSERERKRERQQATSPYLQQVWGLVLRDRFRVKRQHHEGGKGFPLKSNTRI